MAQTCPQGMFLIFLKALGLDFPSSSHQIPLVPITISSKFFCSHQVPKNFPSNSSCSLQVSNKFILFHQVPIKFLLFPSITHQCPFVLIKFPKNSPESSHQSPFVLIKFPNNSHQIPLVPISILLFSSSSQTIPIKFLLFPSNSFLFPWLWRIGR